RRVRGRREPRSPTPAAQRSAGMTPSPALDPSWRRYPYALSASDPEFTFPAAEGDQGAASNTYYVAGRLRGVASGRSWAYLAVFAYNRLRGGIRTDFYSF